MYIFTVAVYNCLYLSVSFLANKRVNKKEKNII